MKKAILVVSFGTTHRDALKKTIEKIEDRIREEFSDYEIRRAFTADKIIRILRTRDGIIENTPGEALEKLRLEGYEEVVVQPLYLISGGEYDYVRNIVDTFREEGAFKKILLGRPALYFNTGDNAAEDFEIFIDSVSEILKYKGTIVMMGHGIDHPANECYTYLQSVFTHKGYSNIYIGTLEGYPSINQIIERLNNDKVKEVTIVPLMLAAGNHVKNDMAGDHKDSWKNLLNSHGIKTNLFVQGLGEIAKFQDIYLQHIKDAMEGKYS
jgi:sirohydrochlorin cobaltochelatase